MQHFIFPLSTLDHRDLELSWDCCLSSIQQQMPYGILAALLQKCRTDLMGFVKDACEQTATAAAHRRSLRVPLWESGPWMIVVMEHHQSGDGHDPEMLSIGFGFEPGHGPQEWAFQTILSEDARRMLHDLSQPLQAIYSFGSSLTRFFSGQDNSLGHKQSKWLATLFEQTERLVNLTKEHRNRYVATPAKAQVFDPRAALALMLWEHGGKQQASGFWQPLLALPMPSELEADGFRLLTALWLHRLILESGASDPALLDPERAPAISFGQAPPPAGSGHGPAEGIVLTLRLPWADARNPVAQAGPQDCTEPLPLGHLAGRGGIVHQALVRTLQELGTPLSDNNKKTTADQPPHHGVGVEEVPILLKGSMTGEWPPSRPKNN